ncbi:oplophorus-luciferin 2-monooxygenase non-catalytic subunit-like [Homarus americanus]|uniref:oplophorus-luciferin 2-monooxygenase non-catalytic subunit-like n=1 Tax=Homarus americanus TaxID=6706 RepID=UPI001C47A920|nr:oplophorus-luciferin 2-monooxygenase non-catalytic subunit-like [Homarus americanus]
MALYHTFLCNLLLGSCCVGAVHTTGVINREAAGDLDTVVSKIAHNYPRKLPCPEDAEILPCVCTFDENMHMDLNCSSVESEDQLATILGSSFPFRNFHKLIIEGNDNLVVLRAGVLGSTTYEVFHIIDGVLEEVESGALSGSYSTATEMMFYNNSINSFPWQEMLLFENLHTLHLQENNITRCPKVKSKSLKKLDLARNPFIYLPVTAFSDTPTLQEVYLDGIGLQELSAGTFFTLSELLMVNMSTNQLTEVHEGAVQFNNSGRHQVYLDYNNISLVAVNAFSGFNSSDEIFLNNNQLTLLEEEVWQPVLQQGVTLYLGGNPLQCGCEIAFIILNSTFLGLIDNSTSCSDGELLVNLDPAIYEQFC